MITLHLISKWYITLRVGNADHKRIVKFCLENKIALCISLAAGSL